MAMMSLSLAGGYAPDVGDDAVQGLFHPDLEEVG
jgi:hypothetical protein